MGGLSRELARKIYAMRPYTRAHILTMALMLARVPCVSAAVEEAPVITIEDSTFLVQAARFGLATIAVTEAAQKKALQEDVKEFTQLLLQEQGKVTEDLKELFKLKRLQFPASAAPSDREKAPGVEEIAAAEKADIAFLSIMIRTHEQVLKTYETASKQCKDPEVLTFLAFSQLILSAHLEKAKQLASSPAWRPAGKPVLPPAGGVAPPVPTRPTPTPPVPTSPLPPPPVPTPPPNPPPRDPGLPPAKKAD